MMMFLLAAIDHVVTIDDTIQWIGKFHLILVHFPIALITLTAVSEWLFLRNNNPLFDHASRFMLAAAAILTIPTVICGLALGYVAEFQGAMETLFEWHRALGIATGILAILCFALKELYVRGIKNTKRAYYLFFTALFIVTSLTGSYGGELTFGPIKYLPPFLS